jgi:hypothetical protein
VLLSYLYTLHSSITGKIRFSSFLLTMDDGDHYLALVVWISIIASIGYQAYLSNSLLAKSPAFLGYLASWAYWLILGILQISTFILLVVACGLDYGKKDHALRVLAAARITETVFQVSALTRTVVNRFNLNLVRIPDFAHRLYSKTPALPTATLVCFCSPRNYRIVHRTFAFFQH